MILENKWWKNFGNVPLKFQSETKQKGGEKTAKKKEKEKVKANCRGGFVAIFQDNKQAEKRKIECQETCFENFFLSL